MGQTTYSEIKQEDQKATRENKHEIFRGYGVSEKTSKKKHYRFAFAIFVAGPDKVTVGASVCSNDDQFVKRIGSNMAELRARKFPQFQISGVDTSTVEGMLVIKNWVRRYIANNAEHTKHMISEKELHDLTID